ncbi:MAG: MBL fold metallo-hydrolase [Bdellovibrionales bacterium]|nr:MBL fold metallo-hydrolase [Bdellovibrionales bacterium]
MSVSIQFLGAASTVTGSKYSVTYQDQKVLVDCGLFQGVKALRLKNWDLPAENPADIAAVILTHAHIDHSGLIPRLINEGFRGKIYATSATTDVCGVLLPDCGSILEEEASYLNKSGRTKHKPALPLFTAKEAEASMAYFHQVPFNITFNATKDIKVAFQYAGHILGASSVILEVDGKRIGFTGDVGRNDDPLFFPPDNLPTVDYLVTESTYGDRIHPVEDLYQVVESIINKTVQREGAIIVPAFAVGRAQALMYLLSVLRREKRIPDVPIYLNSPMAKTFSEIFRKYPNLHRLTETECKAIDEIITIVQTTEASKELNEKKGPMIIISASGMLTGGRVLHHLKAFAPFANNTIMLTGFQSEGTRGAALKNGAKEVKVHGSYVPIRAEVCLLESISAHADHLEMMDWFERSGISPKRVFITHGESIASDEFRKRLEEKFGWQCTVPLHGDTVVLGE